MRCPLAPVRPVVVEWRLSAADAATARVKPIAIAAISANVDIQPSGTDAPPTSGAASRSAACDRATSDL
jgi:hypothetical protein